jgi:hypothetical protein
MISSIADSIPQKENIQRNGPPWTMRNIADINIKFAG